MGSKTDFSGKKTPKLYDLFIFFICAHPPKGQRNSISTYHRIINKITSIQILLLSCVTFFSEILLQNNISGSYIVFIYAKKKNLFLPS